ncbi:MAG: hypothetical protein RBT19_15335 [Tenuifilaceae bacterium]|jgi:hypothetical protein|nr:hypothetical protein [Tenuifilaceae bacterium]
MRFIDKLRRYLDRHFTVPMGLLLLAYMLLIPLPNYLKHHKGVVEKVYEGSIYGRHSRGPGIYVDCLYLKLTHSDSLFNVKGKSMQKVKRANLVGKKVVLKVREHTYSDNLIIQLETASGYVKRYSWFWNCSLIAVMAISVIWIVMVFVFPVKRTIYKPPSPYGRKKKE